MSATPLLTGHLYVLGDHRAVSLDGDRRHSHQRGMRPRCNTRRLSRCYEGSEASATAWLEVASVSYLLGRT